MSRHPPTTTTTNMLNLASQPETFHKFFDSWIIEQDRYLHDLISASKLQDLDSTARYSELRQLIDRVIGHYELYYQAKAKWAKSDVLLMLTPSWLSSLEEAFLWIGGWRPSMAFHLLYSKSGLQLEAKLGDLLRGLSTGDLGDLSPSQMAAVDQLQSKTIKEEKKITEKFAKQQETVADTAMVDLSNVVSEMMRNGEVSGGEAEKERVDSTLATKQEGLEQLFHTADDLRLRTLRGIVSILTPIQAVYFLIAAAELHLRLHDWGMQRDAKRNGVVHH